MTTQHYVYLLMVEPQQVLYSNQYIFIKAFSSAQAAISWCKLYFNSELCSVFDGFGIHQQKYVFEPINYTNADEWQKILQPDVLYSPFVIKVELTYKKDI
jgi:hypothetical protein